MIKDSRLQQLNDRFRGVAQTIGDQLGAANPHVVALVAKWAMDDLVPGLSDMDFRVVCDETTTADDWVKIDWHVGRIHRQMVEEHPEWNRINEHTAGAGVSLGELTETRFHHPEYAVWSVWWGRTDWAERLKARTLAQPLTPLDESYHLSRFLSYYSPYIHGIDPPINLGEFESKYALHSRCWHYFAPPITSAATLLARRHFSGKREALTWLIEEGLAAQQTHAVLDQVDAHYETAEQTDPVRLAKFEQLLFTAFEELFVPVCRSVDHLELPTSISRDQLKQHLDSFVADPLVEFLENVRYSRIRAGRYYFYLNAPAHFSSDLQLVQEQAWTKRLVESTWNLLQILQGGVEDSTEACFKRMGLSVQHDQREAVGFMKWLASSPALDGGIRHEYARAIEVFPTYYRLLELLFTQCLMTSACAGDQDRKRFRRIDDQVAAAIAVPVPAANRVTS